MDQVTIPMVILTCVLSIFSARGYNLHYVTYVERSIDLSTPFVHVRELFNFHSNETTIAKYFVYTSLLNETFIMHFTALGGKSLKTPLKYKKSIQLDDIFTYTVYLDKHLQPGEKSKILIETMLRDQFVEVPYAMKKGDAFSQKHVYIANRFVFSPYKIGLQTTKISAGAKESEISFMNKEPLSRAPLTLHMTNDIKFFIVPKLLREIKVSHWGKIDVQDTVDLRNIGPVPKDKWGVQYKNWSGFRQIVTYLPASAHDIYYRDVLGNLSESIVNKSKKFVELTLFLRFLLLGGWNIQYMLGYKLPSREYLSHSTQDASYLLDMRLFDHIFNDMMIYEATTTIVLPEGSTDLRVSTPTSIQHKIRNDTIQVNGRTASIEMFNLVQKDITNFQLVYSYKMLWILKAPLTYSAMIYFIFLVIIVARRCDFSILNDDSHECEKRKIEKLD